MEQRIIKFRAWDRTEKKFWGRIPTLNLTLGHFGVSGFEWSQFTGLLDKNGVEIYEGDIVLYPDTYTESVDVGVGMMPIAQMQENSFFPVQFRNGMFCMEIKGSEVMDSGFHSIDEVGSETSNEEVGDTLEVIGNIFENPELLK